MYVPYRQYVHRSRDRTAMSSSSSVPAVPASPAAPVVPPSATPAAAPAARAPDPAGGVRAGLVLLLTAGATFIAFLDTTVVNVAFPDLARSFPGDRVSDLSWVVSSYAVLFAALLTPVGRLADA